jgi:hypothetical protein
VVATDKAGNVAAPSAAGSVRVWTHSDGVAGLSAGYWSQHLPGTKGGAAAWGNGNVTLGTGTLGGATLAIGSSGATQLINSSDTANDARQILLKQALAAELNLQNGESAPGQLSNTIPGTNPLTHASTVGTDLITLGVDWLQGKGPFVYSAGTGNIDTSHDGTLQLGTTGTVSNPGGVEYNTKTASFTSTAQVTSGNEWQTAVDSGVFNPATGLDFKINGQDLKNMLQAFNQNQLVTSKDGTMVGWNANGAVGGAVTDIQQNTSTGVFTVLKDAGIIHG